MRKANKEYIGFRCDNDLKNKIEAVAEVNNTTASEVVRHSVNQFIQSTK